MATLTHPSVAIASSVFGEGWEPFDVIERDGEAALVELRQGDLRDTQIIHSRDGGWVEPGLVSRDARSAAVQRPEVTSPEEPVIHQRLSGSAWPASDGSPPSRFWCSLDGLVAADVTMVIVATEIDRYEATVREDGTFLAMVRTDRGESPQVVFRLGSGDEMAVAL